MLREPSAIPQMLYEVSRVISVLGLRSNVHWIHSPEDECEAADGSEEGCGLVVLGLGRLATVDSKLIDDNKIGNASHGIPTPLGSLVNGESRKEASQDHDDISNDGDKNAGTVHASQEAEIEKEEWGGETPVDVSGPVDLTVDGVVRVWEVLLGVLDQNFVLANTITDCHGIV